MRRSHIVAPLQQAGDAARAWQDRVLFIDGEAIVIDKPGGLAVHPGPRTRESLEDYLHHFRFGFARMPTPVHRLDRDTSGCLLLARNPKAHQRFAAAFEGGVADKVYAAVVEGTPEGDAGTIDIALRKATSQESGWRMVADPTGRASRTYWQVVSQQAGRTLIAFRPATGRTHQIRVHAALGLDTPVVGDTIYGRGGGPMLLHSAALTLPRGSKPPVSASAPLPTYFGVFAEAWTARDEG